MTIASNHKYVPDGPVCQSARKAGAEARKRDDAAGIPLTALAPDPWCHHRLTRQAWVAGYMESNP